MEANITTNNINLEDIREKLIQKFKDGGWYDTMKGFLRSEDFMKILEFLYKESQEGRKFTPPLKNVFRVFEECPYDKLKCILLAQDPYSSVTSGVIQATGVAFDCSLTKKIQPSLSYIYKDIFNNLGISLNNPSLDRWSKQGICLLNSSLTTRLGKSGTHNEIWKSFISYLFDMLSMKRNDIVYVFMGKNSQEYMRNVSNNSIKLKCSHPASAAYNNFEKWNSGKIFNQIEENVLKNFNYKIIW